MTRGELVLGEAWHELRQGLRGWTLPLVALGLIVYIPFTLTNAEALREMGAADIPLNSPSIIYILVTSEATFFLFAWAWIFARAVTRETEARLHEVTLAYPVSLSGLFLGRYLGAAGTSSLLGVAGLLGFLLLHPLQAGGFLTARALASPPWLALAWSWVVLVVPSAIGIGAIYLMAALRTRNPAGPFAAAAGISFLWIISMVVLRDGSLSPWLASLVDATAHAEVLEQVIGWTPAEKMVRLLPLSDTMLMNRLLWTVLPLGLLGLRLRRLKRESFLGTNSERKARRTRAGPSIAPGVSGGGPRSDREAVLVTRDLARGELASAADVHVLEHASDPRTPHDWKHRRRLCPGPGRRKGPAHPPSGTFVLSVGST